MLVQQVDVIGLQSAQRSLHGGSYVLRSTVQTKRLDVEAFPPSSIASQFLSRFSLSDTPPELRGDEHLIALPLQRAAEQLLVREWSVHLGRVEEGDTELDGAVDGGDRLALVGGAVRLAHPHAAESER